MSLPHPASAFFAVLLAALPLVAARAAAPATPEAIAELRQQGPEGLARLFAQRDELASQLAAATLPEAAQRLEEELSRLDQLIDQVGAQRYCSRSRLYWYTDLDEAQRAAAASGKPILSLRMLGNLTDELSCANSRFFRTTLYANEQVAAFLRENYILHWRSVRPVPVVTIDFGDGRLLKRTVTGNSIHYVLTPAGDLVDALPGLYGPAAFLSHLTKMASAAREAGQLAPQERPLWLAQYHQRQLEALDLQWMSDWQSISTAPAQRPAEEPPSSSPAPTAVEAARIARPKRRLEMPVLRGIAGIAATRPEDLADEATWQRIAALHEQEARLDASSRRLIASENPTATAAGRLALTKYVVEDPLLKLVRSLESSIAVDTVRNEYQLHRRIHQWLSAPADRIELEAFNDRVYAEIFLTPKSDPWLGLATADAYTALSNAGVVTAGTEAKN